MWLWNALCMLVLDWKFWPHWRQLSVPMEFFLSSCTVTEVSLLQKTHLKEVASGSRWCVSVSCGMARGVWEGGYLLGTLRCAR